MAHEITNIDSLGLYRKPAWHGLGTVIEGQLTAVEAAHRFKMVYPVNKWQLIARCPTTGEELDISSEYTANVRVQDDEDRKVRKLLGVTTAGYQICQNLELAQFADGLADQGKGKVKIETCGTLRGGALVWFLCRTDAFEIGNKGDKVVPYLLVSNGHDGSNAVKVTPTTVRVVCANTLSMVLPEIHGANRMARPEKAAFTFRHTTNLHSRMDQARACLAQYWQVKARNQELFELMRQRELTKGETEEFLATNYAASGWRVATAEDFNTTDQKELKKAERRAARMKDAVKLCMDRIAEEDDKVGSGRTAWAAMNAWTWYLQHARKAPGDTEARKASWRLEQNLFGINKERSYEALAGAMALAS